MLHADTETNTKEDLVADPRRLTSAHLEGSDETSASSHEDGGDKHPGCVVTSLGDDGTGDDGTADETENHGNGVNTRLHSTDTLDGLEPDGEAVEHGDEAATDEHGEGDTAVDAAHLDDARRDGGLLLSPDLNADEAEEQDAREHEESNDAGAVPGVGVAAPLESEEEADDAGEEDDGSDGVETPELFLEGSVDLVVLDVEEEDQNRENNGTNGETKPLLALQKFKVSR